MEAFYKSFFLIRAFLKSDARVPPEIALPDAEDRFVTRELEQRKAFPVMDVISVLRDMAQQKLLITEPITDILPVASLTEAGLKAAPSQKDLSEIISLSPFSKTT